MLGLLSMAPKKLRQLSIPGSQKMKSQSSPKKKKKTKNQEQNTVSKYNSGQKFTFFYSSASPFSQHHKCVFTVDGKSYNCAEQYMMHKKAVLFNDSKMAEEIMKAESPVVQKRLGRKVKPFDPEKWNSSCRKIVKMGNLAKFSQNHALKKSLFDTARTILVEASPRDRNWGIGMSETKAAVTDPKEWKGKNLLGEILTEVREELLARESVELIREDDEFGLGEGSS